MMLPSHLARLFGVLLFIFLLWPAVGFAQQTAANWPHRVLITNDDGIDSTKMIALAQAFAPNTETWVVAPLEDKSGSSHYTTINRRKELAVESHNLGPGIRAFGVDGYPADCVILALAGVMKDSPPDLVISGINGGANLGQDWLGSGTIGAARMASFAGVPAIAVSGVSREIPGSVEAAARWVVEFAQTDLVRQLRPPQYLTVSIPRIPASQIKGLRIARRSGLQKWPVLSKDPRQTNGHRDLWRITGTRPSTTPQPAENDIALYNKGHIVVVPMLADEHDLEALSRLRYGR